MSDSTSSSSTPAIRPVMDREEAADYLRISIRLLTNLVRNRRLRPAYIGRRCVFLRTELDRFLSVLTTQSA